MICRNCGTEIANNALICYRCGTAVDDLPSVPARPPSRRRSGMGLVGPALALIVLVLAALFLGRAASQELPPAVAWIAGALAVIVLAWWSWARRGRKRRKQ